MFGGSSDEERGDVDHLFADSDVSLSDEDASLMYGSSEVSLDNEGLESTFHELVDGQTEDVIEFTLVLVEETKSDHALDEGITCNKNNGCYSNIKYKLRCGSGVLLTFENSSGIGLIHSQ